MKIQPYSNLIRYKQWADRGLCEVATASFDKLESQDATILVRILDHIQVVDRIFQNHLQGKPHSFQAPRSETLPDIQTLCDYFRETDNWYVSYVDTLPDSRLNEPLTFSFTSGAKADMTRAEAILHICMHGTYHRGNAGIVLQKNGITPNDDRITDFIQIAA